MPKLPRKLKVVLLPIGLLLLIAGVLWLPYKVGVIPEWKLQIVDSDGHPVVGAQVVEEWNNPIEEGITFAEVQKTGANGFVVLPEHRLTNRLAFGVPRFTPSALIMVCTEDQYGDVIWDKKNGPIPSRLELKKGHCPYS